MTKSNELLAALKKIVIKYEAANKDKEALKYQTIDENGELIKKNCILQAAYAYQFVNVYGDKCHNLILIYEGWTPLLQKIAMNGIHRGQEKDNKLGTNISIYALNINDFNLDDNSMLMYKDTMIIMDKIGLFSSLKNENNHHKKVKTMI